MDRRHRGRCRLATLVAAALCLCALLFGAGELAARGAAAVVEASAFRSRATAPNIEVKFDFSPFLI